MSESLVQELRRLLFSPSENNWLELCFTMEEWESLEEFPLLLEYVLTHLEEWPEVMKGHRLAGWPQHSRFAPEVWTNQLLDGKAPTACWPMVRQLRFRFQKIGDNKAIDWLEKGWLSELSHLYLDAATLQRDFLIQLTSTSSMPRLTHLGLFGNHLHRDAIEALSLWPDALQLQYLDLGGCRLGDHALQLLLESPYLQNLRALRISQNMIGMEGLYALARTEALPSVEFLSLGEQMSAVSSEPLMREGKPHIYRAQFAGQIGDKTTPELKRFCKEQGWKGYSRLKKAELLELILERWPGHRHLEGM